MKRQFALAASAALLVAGTTAYADPAIQSWTGGSTFGIYYGASTGDVVGWRFTVNDPIIATHLGVYMFQGQLRDARQVGIWDGSQMLISSTTVDPATGITVGNFMYQSVPGVALIPGQTYTIGALYFSGSNDQYASGVSNLVTAPEVNWVQSVYPSAGSLGFVYPELNTTSGGRFGPNFLYIPSPGALALLGMGGIIALRRRR